MKNGSNTLKSIFIAILFWFLSSGASSLSSSEANIIIDNDEIRLKVVITALSWLGTPYKYGGLTKNGIDCSGFIIKTYEEAVGGTYPRSASSLAKLGIPVTSDPLPGDIVLFANKGSVFHAGIYIGDRNVIHAASSGDKTGVIISNLDSPWYKTYYYGMRRYIIDEKKDTDHE